MKKQTELIDLIALNLSTSAPILTIDNQDRPLSLSSLDNLFHAIPNACCIGTTKAVKRILSRIERGKWDGLDLYADKVSFGAESKECDLKICFYDGLPIYVLSEGSTLGNTLYVANIKEQTLARIINISSSHAVA
jgi:hypothetical protein